MGDLGNKLKLPLDWHSPSGDTLGKVAKGDGDIVRLISAQGDNISLRSK